LLPNQIVGEIENELNLEKWFQKGGPGSGHWGHRGRKGKRGGSAPSRGLAKLSAPVGNAGVEGNRGVDKLLTDTLFPGEEVVTKPKPGDWEYATTNERAKLKAQVARDLSEVSGVTEQEAADFVRQWAHSSNDNDMRSLAVQQDAAKEFGLKTSEFTQGKIDNMKEYRQKQLKRLEEGYTIEQLGVRWASVNPLMESDKQRALLRSMYNETQAELKARGIKEVRLYRGARLPDDGKWPDRIGGAIPVETNAVESWSVSARVARNFATPQSGGDIGVVFVTVVPANRILSTPATGFGCLREGEVVVLGGIDGDNARVAGIR